MGPELDLEERQERKISAVRLLASLAEVARGFPGNPVGVGAGIKKRMGGLSNHKNLLTTQLESLSTLL